MCVRLQQTQPQVGEHRGLEEVHELIDLDQRPHRHLRLGVAHRPHHPERVSVRPGQQTQRHGGHGAVAPARVQREEQFDAVATRLTPFLKGFTRLSHR